MRKATELYLVRHGTTSFNREKRFRGRTQIPLDDGGREQARAAAQALADVGLSVIYTSPLRRAVETSEVISEVLGCPVVEDEGLIDVDYGEWQGLTVEEVNDKYGQSMMKSWMEDPADFHFPGGECLSEVKDRLEQALKRLGRAHGGEAIAAVSHLAVLKLAYFIAKGTEVSGFIELPVDNGSVGHIRYSDGELKLRTWNFVERVN